MEARVAVDGSDNSAEATRGSERVRKPYQPPVLRRYGDLARITESVGFMGNKDGGTVILMRKTS